MIYLYRLIKKRVDLYLYGLFQENKIWYGLPLSIISRKFFFREFFPNKKSYSTIEELNSIIEDTFQSQSTNLILKNLTSYRKKKYKSVSNKKVLFISSDNVKNSDKYINANFAKYINSANHAGIITSFFEASQISYNFEVVDSIRLQNAKKVIKKLLNKISSYQPDLIFVDTNYFPDLANFNEDVVSSIRSICSAKIVGHIDDLFTDEDHRKAHIWEKFLDIVVHTSPGWKYKTKGNIIYIPTPTDPLSFYPAKKTNGIFFSGIGNLPRFPYLFIAKLFCQKNNISHYIKIHDRKIVNALSRDEFNRYIRESHAVLEMTARSSTIRPTGGRSRIPLICKSLLIMEKSVDMNNFIVPYLHYIPFDNKRELELAIQLTFESKKLVNKITDAAYTFVRKHYNGDIIWKEIFHHANSTKKKL